MEKIYTEMLSEAKNVSKNAYAPYSNFKVGACVLYESGKRYMGCNVENASYGLSICAERNAIANAISNEENTKIKAIAIYSPSQANCLPCGACRQWIQEFSDDETKIILENEKGGIKTFQFFEIFPSPFQIN